MTIADPRYVITRKSGVDTLHRNPLEQCHLDDTAADQRIDEFHAEKLLLAGDVKPCGHCLKDDWG
jgi:hypothetical protein